MYVIENMASLEKLSSYYLKNMKLISHKNSEKITVKKHETEKKTKKKKKDLR